MPIHPARVKECLGNFDFHHLFVEQLGWSRPLSAKPVTFVAADEEFTRRPIAQLGGVFVYEVTASKGAIPSAKTRASVYKEIAALHHENLLIFIDGERTQSLWYWVKREGGKTYPRDHYYARHQPGDLFLGKLSALVFEIGELDPTGDASVVEIAKRLREALDIERVTKKFYAEYDTLHTEFIELIGGIANGRDRTWYASVLLNRLMFIYFLQRKGFIDDCDLEYLQHKLAATQEKGGDLFYSTFLKLLFFEGFAKTKDRRSEQARRVLGNIKYLNGGLFLQHRIEIDNPDIAIPDKAFENILDLFRRYSWNLNDTPGGDDDEINPDVLGYIFEKYINQKAFGAYYTAPEITEYLCERTIHYVILDKVRNTPSLGLRNRDYDSINELLMDLDNDLCRDLIYEILPKLTVLDPACGSGAFLVAAMKTLLNIYGAVVGRIKVGSSSNLKKWLHDVERDHVNLGYYIRKRIITGNLFGVDIMEEATEIARLRLFLALVAYANDVDQLEPLPNVDFNVLPGNSLMGLMRVDDADFDKRHKQGNLFQKSYRELLAEKNRKIGTYRHAASYMDDLRTLRDDIQEMEKDAEATLDEILLKEFNDLGIRFERLTWDQKSGELGKPSRRQLKTGDIRALRAFHWGYQFDEILNGNGLGGFDVIVTNPPWEIFKSNAKEFFERHSDLVSKNNMTIHDFEAEQSKLLKNPAIREAWIEYLSGYPHQAAYFRSASNFKNQTSVVNGKKVGSDTNFYKLFIEQAYNLLRDGGRCGIVAPGSVYADLGAKRLREMLLFECEVDSLFGLTNERYIFEGVEHRQKFCILAFEKAGTTESFRAAFRINTREAIARDKLDEFLNSPKEHLHLSTDLIRRLSPDSLSIMEFKNEMDVRIAEKMLTFPLLGEQKAGTWNVHLTAEFHMTNDSGIFKRGPGRNRIPLMEGKMIHQFDSAFASPRYWVVEKEGRETILGERADPGQPLDYQTYRLAFRDVASNTNERTMIATVVGPGFLGNTLPAVTPRGDDNKVLIDESQQLFLCAVFNSFTVDWLVRSKVTSHLNFFAVYQLPIPRLTKSDAQFAPIVDRAARLVCISPVFDELARHAGLSGHEDGVTDPAARDRLRAELDGIIANFYGLTEEEFAHILGTFPLISQEAKDAALVAFREFAPKSVDEQIAALIVAGESSTVEFKSSVRWDMRENRLNEALKFSVIKTVAAFLNSNGGTLLIGVDDDRKIVGLQGDYSQFKKTDVRDAFENWLTTQLINQFGKPATRLFSLTFHEVEGKDICRIESQPSPSPIFVDEGGGKPSQLYIRTGNASRALDMREVIEFSRHRWPTG
jgi:Putative DNA-binding domain